MAKRNGNNLTEDEARTARLEKLAARKKKALDALAEVKDMERELGVAVEEEEEIVPPEGIVPEADLSRLEKIVTELEGEGSFEVFYQDNGSEAKVGKYDIRDWPNRMEQIAKKKGGGDFKVVFRNSSGHYAGQTTRTYDPDAYGGKRGGSDGGADMGRFLEILERKEESHQRAMESLRLEMTKMQMEMIKAMSGGGVMRNAQDIALIAKLFKEDTKKEDTFEQVRKFTDLLTYLKEGPAAEPVPFLQDAITKGLSLLKPIVEAGARRLNAPAPGAGTPGTIPALPATASAGMPGPVAAAQSSVPASADPVLTAYAQRLSMAIVQGLTPNSVATLIFENIEEKDVDGLRMVAGDMEIEKKLSSISPTIRQNPSWIADFFQAIRENFSQMDEIGSLDVPAKEAEGQEDASPAG